jgi:diketogulonate reductase-like aldo/keto reductase
VQWLQLGGRRIDNSASYHNQLPVGIAMAASGEAHAKTFTVHRISHGLVRLAGIPRNQIFLTSKVGPYLPLGYNETLAQVWWMTACPSFPFDELL